jgi:hypothetical protein
MEIAMHGVRDLVALSRVLRQYAQDTTLPTYRQNFLRAAAELDAQVVQQTTILPENWPTSEEDQKLHQRVDLKV